MTEWDQLGFWLLCMIYIVLSALGCGIFFLGRWLWKKIRFYRAVAETDFDVSWAEDGKWMDRLLRRILAWELSDTARGRLQLGSRIFFDLLNLVCVLGLILLILVPGTVYIGDTVRDTRNRQELQENERFRDEVLRQGYMNEDEIMNEGYYYALAIENFSDHPEAVTVQISPGGKTTISWEVLQEGMAHFAEVKSRYSISRGVEMINWQAVYEAKSRTIKTAAEFQVLDEAENSMFAYHAIVVFDERWRVKEIYYQKDRLE